MLKFIHCPKSSNRKFVLQISQTLFFITIDFVLSQIINIIIIIIKQKERKTESITSKKKFNPHKKLNVSIEILFILFFNLF